jgi:HAD superfamily hydrolase (TIGR01509 family)
MELLEYLSDAAHLYDDVRPVLRALRAAHTRVAIVSNCDHVTRPVLANLNLEEEVDATVLSCEVHSLKPEAAIFEQALKRLGASAAEAVFVDDQARYLDGARALGIGTAQIVRTPSHGEPSEGGAHRLIASLTDLPGY